MTRRLKLKGGQVRSGVPTVPPAYGARRPGWEKAIRVERSNDHAITGATVPSAPARFFCFPIHILADFGNNKLRLRDGEGMEETTSEKGRDANDETGHQLRAIEGQLNI